MKLLKNAQTLLRKSDSPVGDPTPVDSDFALLQAARTMDQAALVQIFDRYATALYRYARRLSADPLLADQTVGDVFARLLEQFSAGMGPRSNLRSYLYQMTYHVVVDEMRYSKRRAPLEALEDFGEDDSAFGSVDDRIMFEKVMQVVRNSLTPDQQNIIILRFLEGMSLQETALIMGKQVNHVKVLQNRAIQRLRKSLLENGEKDTRLDTVTGRLVLGFDFAG